MRLPRSRALPRAPFRAVGRLALLAAATTLLPGALSAQRGMPGDPGDGPRQGVLVGIRAGYDMEVQGGALILGAGTRISIPGLRSLEVQGLGDFTFLDNLTERQINVDLLYRLGGFSIGGGPAFRNTTWLDSQGARETRTGWSAVAIIGGHPSRTLLAAQIELRWTKVSDFSPQGIHLGVNVPLARF